MFFHPLPKNYGCIYLGLTTTEQRETRKSTLEFACESSVKNENAAPTAARPTNPGESSKTIDPTPTG